MKVDHVHGFVLAGRYTLRAAVYVGEAEPTAETALAAGGAETAQATAAAH